MNTTNLRRASTVRGSVSQRSPDWAYFRISLSKYAATDALQIPFLARPKRPFRFSARAAGAAEFVHPGA
jgi:hypothetical protein